MTRLSCEWYTGWEGKGPGIEVTLAELRKEHDQEVGKQVKSPDWLVR